MSPRVAVHLALAVVLDEKFPRGKLRPDDEGSLKIAVTVKDGTLVVHFGKPIVWLGLGYEEAKALGELLLRRAEELRQ